MKFGISCLCLVLTFFVMAGNVSAKAINLYEQPKLNSKTVGSVDPDQGIILIFTPKEGGWVKVADPHNGNVGWIQSNEVKQAQSRMNIIQTGQQPFNYQLIQYGTMQPLSSEQAQKALQQIKKRREAAQQEMQKMMKEMMDTFPLFWGNIPVMVPVIVVPDKGKATTSPPVSTSSPAPLTDTSSNPSLQKENKNKNK